MQLSKYFLLVAFYIFSFACFAKEEIIEMQPFDLGTLQVKLNSSVGAQKKSIVHKFDNEFGMGKTTTSFYDGAEIDFREGKNGFYIWRLKITSATWAYKNNQIRVGIIIEKLKTLIGPPDSIETSDSKAYWFYHLYEYNAWTRITIVNGKVIEIFAAEDWS